MFWMIIIAIVILTMIISKLDNERLVDSIGPAIVILLWCIPFGIMYLINPILLISTISLLVIGVACNWKNVK